MPEIPPDGVANPTPPDTFPFYVGRIKELMRGYHADINAHVQDALDDLHARWNAPRAALNVTIARLEREMQQALDAGDTITYAWLAQADRLARLKADVAGDVQQFANGARQLVGDAQTDAIGAGQAAAQEALAATVPPGMQMTFGVPPSDVTDELAGALQPGSPLASLFDSFGADAAQLAQQALFTSVALGEGARDAASRLEWATNMSAQRAEVIARTEIARSWRGAQMANYRANSDVVQQWMWAADFGPRCCGACSAMDGTLHSLDEELDDHVCGRCSALPITVPWSQILGDAGLSQDVINGLNLTETSLAAQGRESAADWLARQTPEMQNSIMGPAKAEAWRQGALELRDLVEYRYSPQWGWSLGESSMADLRLDPQRYLADWRSGSTATRAGAELSAQLSQAAASLDLADAKRAADAWYANIEDSIAFGVGAQSPAALAEAKAAADAWYAEIEQSIARGVAPASSAEAFETGSGSLWDIRREEAIAVAEGRAEFLSSKPVELNGEQGSEPAFSPLAAPGGAREVATYTLTDEDRAFVRQLRDALPVGGVTSADEALALGRQIAAQLHNDPEVARLEQFAQEAADIRARLPGNVTEEERAWFAGSAGELALQAQADHDGLSPFKVGELYQSAYQARVRAYLGEFRDLGGVELKFATEDGAYDALVAGHLETVSDLVPSDWLRASNDLGELVPYRMRRRAAVGEYRDLPDGMGLLAVGYNKQSDVADLESVALHELTHRMEGAVPGLAQIEGEFYNARTTGEDFVDLTNGIKQRTKLDQWLDEYLGREPISTRATPYEAPIGPLHPDKTYQSKYAKTYELMTMGVEATLAPGGGAERFALLADKEYEAFVLGALFGVQAPEAEAALTAAEDAAAGAAGAGEAAFAPRVTVGTALSAEERAAVQDAVAQGALPKSYAKYTSVEQLTKTAKGRDWYTAKSAPEATAETAAPSVPTLLTDAERQAVQDAVAAGDLPKSYVKYTSVEQLTKTKKGSAWYAANGAPAEPAPITETVRDASYAAGVEFPEPTAGEGAMPPDVAPPELPFTVEQFTAADLRPLSRDLAGANDSYTAVIDGQKYLIKDTGSNAPSDAVARYRAQAEATSNQIAQLLGFGEQVTPTYALTVDGQTYVASQWMEGTKTLAQARGAFIENVSEENLRDLTLQEYLVGEGDRNFGNYLYDPETHQAYTIDHSDALRSDRALPLSASGAVRVWAAQQEGVTFAQTQYGQNGWTQMTYDRSQLQRISAQESQVIALMRANGLDAGIPGVETRFAVLRELSGLPQPTYADLARIARRYDLQRELDALIDPSEE